MITNDIMKLAFLLNWTLSDNSPILSSNMRQGIKLKSIGENEITIEIKAPFYDMKEWKKTKKIQHTGKIINGKTDYAMWVNELGGFATGNESMHWVNRAVNKAVDTIANELDAEKINELPL